MIYLSGTLKPKDVAARLDIGLLLGFRPDGDFNGQAKYAGEVLWAADNNCFNNPEVTVKDYLTWLGQMSEFRETCLFANALDVVADARATWERSRDVLPEIRKLGYPAALVAQKASSRAKKYGMTSYRGLSYDRKGGALRDLCAALEEHGRGLGITFGWGRDDGCFNPWVLYVEIPQGQVSFHSPERYDGPDYPREWDGLRASEARIICYCDEVLKGTAYE